MGEWISLLFASLCLTARLALCYHGNRDWFGMVRSMEGEKREKKGGKRPPAVFHQQPKGNLAKETGDDPQLPASCNINAALSHVPLSSSFCFTPTLYSLQHVSPNLLFLSSVPSIQEYEWVMTAGWPRVVNKNCNYKNVSPTYYNRHDSGAITCLTSVLVGHMKSIYNTIYKFILFTT